MIGRCKTLSLHQLHGKFIVSDVFNRIHCMNHWRAKIQNWELEREKTQPNVVHTPIDHTKTTYRSYFILKTPRVNMSAVRSEASLLCLLISCRRSRMSGVPEDNKSYRSSKATFVKSFRFIFFGAPKRTPRIRLTRSRKTLEML